LNWFSDKKRWGGCWWGRWVKEAFGDKMYPQDKSLAENGMTLYQKKGDRGETRS